MMINVFHKYVYATKQNYTMIIIIIIIISIDWKGHNNGNNCGLVFEGTAAVAVRWDHITVSSCGKGGDV